MEDIIGRITRETDTETNTETGMEMDIVMITKTGKRLGKENRKRKTRERMATWNVTGLGDHVPEIVEIMKKRNILLFWEFRTAEQRIWIKTD